MDRKTPVIVTPEGTVTIFPPDNGKHYTLEELQEAVGGYIQLLPIPDGQSPKRVVVMNEEGRLHGLPRNDIASQAFGSDALIVGTVVVCPSRMIR